MRGEGFLFISGSFPVEYMTMHKEATNVWNLFNCIA
jgi:hypothetical protein